ncbi:transposase [Humitalea sp. 24SJ18S-53]|uniref:transposase n=1 Tax=Humitalea sp. 24SJ18S-53 TaxID=3422307 RepID=UPI003D67588E
MQRHYTPIRPWTPMTDPEWDALRPHVLWLGAGRPVKTLRARVDGMFWAATTRNPWKDLPEDFGKPGTVARHFRRLTLRHLWAKLLHLLADPKCLPGLAALEHYICRACQRACRSKGLALITTARRLGFLSALRGPSWLLPNPDLSETVQRLINGVLERVLSDWRKVPKGLLTLYGRALVIAGGRKRIPRCLMPD